MLNIEIPQSKIDKIKIAFFDSDGVCVERGTEIMESSDGVKYNSSFQTNVLSDEMADKLNQLSKKIKVVIASGRSLLYLRTMYSKIIGENVIFMAENGNVWFKSGRIVSRKYPVSYFEKLATIRCQIKNLPILGFEPKQFILTVHCEKELQEVYDIVKKYDPNGELRIMWNGEAFDIQRDGTSKGDALKWILGNIEKDNFKLENTIAIGDRINDKEMVRAAYIGVSADIGKLNAKYYTTGKKLGGEVLVDYLLKKL